MSRRTGTGDGVRAASSSGLTLVLCSIRSLVKPIMPSSPWESRLGGCWVWEGSGQGCRREGVEAGTYHK